MKKPSKLALEARAARKRYVAEKRTIRILHPIKVRCTQCGEVYDVHELKHGFESQGCTAAYRTRGSAA